MTKEDLDCWSIIIKKAVGKSIWIGEESDLFDVMNVYYVMRNEGLLYLVTGWKPDFGFTFVVSKLNSILKELSFVECVECVIEQNELSLWRIK